MKILKILFVFVCFVIVVRLYLYGYFHEGTTVTDFMKSPKYFSELPNPVQAVYLIELDKSETWDARAVVNLDSSKVDMKYENLDTHGFYPSKQRITIGDKKFIFPFNGNQESYPFILYNKNLFYLKSMDNIEEPNEIIKAYYGVINLEKYLDY